MTLSITSRGAAALLLWPALAAATITNVSVDGTSSTQAVLRYTAPSLAACTVQVSESSSLQPLVHDVDPSLFAQENLDSRGGNVTSGRTRVFVIGKRRADRGVDGHWYSRALQAYTLHYFQVACGSDEAGGTFTTTNIPLGNTYNEDLPGDPKAASASYYVAGGQYAWPEFTNWVNTSGRSETVIDPQTGMLLKRVTMPQDQPTGNAPAGDHSFATVIDFDKAWNNPAAIQADDNSAASFTGSGSNWLFLRDQNLAFSDAYPVESIVFSVKGWCSGTCRGNDAKIQACITVNGVSCWPNNANAIDVLLGTTVRTSAFATAGSPVPPMASWTPAGYNPLVRGDIQPISGQVSVDSSGNVTWLNGSLFYLNWVAGSKVTIAGSECALAGPATAEHLTIDLTTCLPGLTVPQNQANYVAGNFGIMVRKKNSSLDTIFLQYAKYTINTSVMLGWPSSGSPQVCSDTLTADTMTGAMGYRCVIGGGLPMVYWIDHASGDAHYLGFLSYSGQGGSTGFQSGLCNNPSTTLAGTGGPTGAESLYCTGLDLTGKEVVLACKVTSNNESNNLQVTCSNLTPSSTSSDLLTLIGQFTAGYTPSFNGQLFQNCQISGIQNGRLVMGCNESQQDTLAWVVVFDPARMDSVPGCVGGGLPGCVVAASTTWHTAPARWCVLHTLFQTGASDTAWVAGKFFDAGPGLPGAGPYISTVTAGNLAKDASIPQGQGGCPANSYGCDVVTVDGEPCNPTPATVDAGNCAKKSGQAYLQDANPGDVFEITDNDELVMLVSKSGNNWLLQRGYGNSVAAPHSALAVLSPLCMARRYDVGQSNDSWTWDYLADPHGLNASGTTMRILYDYDHPVPRPNLVVGGAPWYDPNNVGGYAVLDGAGFGNPNVYPALGPTFAGTQGVTTYVEAAQDHASRSQDNAPATEKWFLDARPASSLGPSLADQATIVSGQLYKFASVTADGDNLTQIGGPNAFLGGLNRKQQATMAFCGTQPLTDVSSPATGNVIGDSSTDSYHYCIARNAGECRSGAVSGDIYVNCPNTTPRWDGSYGCSYTNDMCVYTTGAYLDGVSQIGYQATDVDGKLGRLVTKGLIRQRLNDVNQDVRTLPDGSWLLFRITAMSGSRDEIVVGKLPPYPAQDTISRGSLIPITLKLTPPAGIGATNAIVEFGYLENGLADQFYCTTRQDTCVAVSAKIGSNPFSFASEGTGGMESGLTGSACAEGCSVSVPALAQRVIYYRVKYRDGKNQTLAQTGVQVIITP